MKRWLLVGLLCMAGTLPVFSLDRNAFTITSYRLDAEIDRPTHVMAITGRLVLRNDSKASQKHVALQVSSSLQWNMIGTDQKPLDCECEVDPSEHSLQWLSEPYTSDIDHSGSLSEAIVTLEKDVPPGGSVALDVQYGGTVTVNATRLTRMGVTRELAERSDWDQIGDPFTAVRGLGYVVWYPVSIEAVSMSEGNSVSDAIARWKERQHNTDFFVFFGVAVSPNPSKPCVASVPASGAGSSKIEGDATAEKPMFGAVMKSHGLDLIVPSFALFSTCDTLSRPNAEITFNPDHSLVAKDYAAAAEASGPFLDSWLPQDSNRLVRVIELADPDANPYQDGSTLFVPLLSATQQNLQLLLLPTQVAARFSTPRPWIQDGLGIFMQAIFNRERSGRGAALKFLDQYEPPLAKAEELSRGTKAPDTKARASSDSDNILLNTSDEVYLRVKGGFVYWMLHDMLGDAAVQHALAAYHGGADKDPAHFQKLLELQTKRDLEWFFDDWVYRDRGLPDFHIVSAFSRKLLAGSGNEYQVTATIENLGDAGAEVPVTVQTAKGERVVRVVVHAHDKGYARVELPELPTRVVVNDGSVPEVKTGNNVYEFETKPQP